MLFYLEILITTFVLPFPSMSPTRSSAGRCQLAMRIKIANVVYLWTSYSPPSFWEIVDHYSKTSNPESVYRIGEYDPTASVPPGNSLMRDARREWYVDDLRLWADNLWQEGQALSVDMLSKQLALSLISSKPQNINFPLEVIMLLLLASRLATVLGQQLSFLCSQSRSAALPTLETAKRTYYSSD